MNCAALAVPAGLGWPEPARYPALFDLVLAQPQHEALAKAYGSELPWETVRPLDVAQEGSELDADDP